MLRNFISLFFFEIEDENGINGRNVQLLVKHCVSKIVDLAECEEEVMENDALNAIFDEFT